MIIALHAYRPIKQLCSYSGNNAGTFRLIDAETVAMVSGIFGGIIFEFHRDCCRVKISPSRNCFDFVGEFSTDELLRVLLSHNIIKASDLDDYD